MTDSPALAKSRRYSDDHAEEVDSKVESRSLRAFVTGRTGPVTDPECSRGVSIRKESAEK